MTRRSAIIAGALLMVASGSAVTLAAPPWSAGQPVSASAATARPELVSASVVGSTTAGTTNQSYEQTQVDYLFDGPVGGTPKASAFTLTGFDGQFRLTGQQAALGDTQHDVLVTFGTATASVGRDQMTNVSIAGVSGGAVQDPATTLANPPGSVPIGQPRVVQNAPGVTVAPDLIGVTNFASSPTDPFDTMVDFVFDKPANLVVTHGAAPTMDTGLLPHLVLHDGSVVTCQLASGDGTTRLTASCPNSSSTGASSLTPLAQATVSRGYVDAGTVSLLSGQTSASTAALANVLQAAPVSETAKQAAPHLTGVVYQPNISVSVGNRTELADRVFYVFDQPVTVGTSGTCANASQGANGSCFLLYTTDGHQLSAAGSNGASPSVPGNPPTLMSDGTGQATEVQVTVPAGSLASVAGAAVLPGAVAAVNGSASNLADSVAQAFHGQTTFVPGTTDAPTLSGVHVDTASPITATFYFDRDLAFLANPVSSASQFYLLDQDGTELSCAHAVQSNGGPPGFNNSVTCDNFQSAGGTGTPVSAPDSAVADAVVGAVEAGGVKSLSGVPNIESSILTDVLPAVAGVTPSHGSVYGGAVVTIAGSGFANARSVHFGDTNVRRFAVTSPTSITAVAPPGLAGQVDVTVTTVSGTSATEGADKFIYDHAPAVTGLRPTSGPARGGTELAINGSGFTNVTRVLFGTTRAPHFSVTSPGSITVVTPRRPPGRVNVRVVTSSHGTSDVSAGDAFTFLQAAPTLSGIHPKSGPADGGTRVTITGGHFNRVLAVRFGAASGTRLHVRSNHRLIVTTPSHPRGTVLVRVVTTAGRSSHPLRFTYKAARRGAY